MYRSAGADGKAAAGPEGEIRFLRRRASRKLQRLIGNSANKDLFFVLVESDGLVVHGSDPFYASSYRGGPFVGSLDLPEALQSFRSIK